MTPADVGARPATRAMVRALAVAVGFSLVGGLFMRMTQVSRMRNHVISGAPPNSVRLDGSPAAFDSLDPKCPTVFLLGSSQSDAVTSLVRGGQIAWDLAGTTIDELALLSGHPEACFVRMSMPAMLPTEMAVYIGFQAEMVAPPKLVIMELHWESLAHDVTFREEPRGLLANKDFRRRYFDDLRAADAPPAFREALDGWAHEVDAAGEALAVRPPASRMDEPLIDEVRQVFPWFQNLDTQSSVQRLIVFPALALLTGGGSTNQHGVVAQHLALNLDAVRGVARYLRRKGIPLLVSIGPRRHDVLPLTDLTGEVATMGGLAQELEALGATVLDLSAAVPDEMFGWAGNHRDRLHFSLPAHRLVAERLVHDGRSAGAFRLLDSTP